MVLYTRPCACAPICAPIFGFICVGIVASFGFSMCQRIALKAAQAAPMLTPGDFYVRRFGFVNAAKSRTSALLVRTLNRPGAHYPARCCRWSMTYSQMFPASRAACSMMRAASSRLPMPSACAAARSNTRRRYAWQAMGISSSSVSSRALVS